MAYTPGVARVCMAIKEDPVARLHPDHQAQLGGGGHRRDRGAGPGRHRAGSGDAGHGGQGHALQGAGGGGRVSHRLNTKDPEKIIETVKLIAPAFGGINLEDISAPRCFEVESRLRKELDIPVFHDDQHGTAVVVLAALLNALKIVKKDRKRLRVVVSGVGAAGTAIIKILLAVGVRNIIGVDEHGTIHRGRKVGMDFMKSWVAEATNPQNVRGKMSDAIRGADVFIGLSVPGVLTVKDVGAWRATASSSPWPTRCRRSAPEAAEPHVRVMATGRSDYPNQINNVLCFPGFFRGLLDSRARSVNDEMKLAAAHAIASCVGKSELGPEYIIPSVFNKQVAPAVAREVVRAAQKTGVARRRPPRRQPALVLSRPRVAPPAALRWSVVIPAFNEARSPPPLSLRRGELLRRARRALRGAGGGRREHRRHRGAGARGVAPAHPAVRAAEPGDQSGQGRGGAGGDAPCPRGRSGSWPTPTAPRPSGR